jgi:opacity protein-like surface antigen
MRKLVVAVALAFVTAGAAPSKASADWLFTPFLGSTFGGSANFAGGGEDFDTDIARNVTYGASLGWMGAGVLGWEVDFGYSPNFFEAEQDFAVTGDGNVTTFMGNVILGAPMAGVRPYATGGVGLLRTRVRDAGDFFTDVNSNEFGYNLGAGIMGFPAQNVGVRADVRYFRSFRDTDSGDDFDLGLGQFNFWRGTVGVAFRF